MGRELTEAIIDGILGGGVYALMAVGLTLIFGVLDIINIAQGILVVLGAYLSYVLAAGTRNSPRPRSAARLPVRFGGFDS
jgi:branched-chain amino acid transport system permease protein